MNELTIPSTAELEDLEHIDDESGGSDHGHVVPKEEDLSFPEMLSRFHEYESTEEAKIQPGEDGHEEMSGNGPDESGEISDKLSDGTIGSESEASDGTYTESVLANFDNAEVTESEGVDPELLEFGGEDFERVFGQDNRVRVGNTSAFPFRTICKLEITAADGARFGCSGALIGPRTVLTNGHCVYMHNRGGWVRSIRVIPGKNGSSEPYGSAVSRQYHSVRGWTNSRSSNYDYAVIVLPSDQKLGNSAGYMGIARLSFFSLMGLRVNNSGYPGDKPDGTQWWNSNNVLAVTARRLFYRLDTFGGQSGSPVWRLKDGRRHIVAVHNTGGPVFNGSVRIGKGVFDNLVRWKNLYV